MRYPLIVWFAIILHLCWGGMILVDRATLNTTPIHTISQVFDGWEYIVIVLFVVAGAAIAGMMLPKIGPTIRLALMLPQQGLLVITAVGALTAMIGGHYADGVPRSHLFIAADQLPAVLVAVLHTIAILAMHRAGGPWKR